VVPRERPARRPRPRLRALRRQGEERAPLRQPRRRETRRLRGGGGSRSLAGVVAPRESDVDGAGGGAPGAAGAGVRRVVARLHGDRDCQRETGVGGSRRRHAESNRLLGRVAGVSEQTVGGGKRFSREVSEKKLE